MTSRFVLPTASAAPAFSSDGSVLSVIDTHGVSLIDVKTSAVKCRIEHAGVILCTFSSTGKYVVTYSKYHKSEQNSRDENNLRIYLWKGFTVGEEIMSFKQKTFERPSPIHWTQNDDFFGKLFPNEIQFFPATE